MFAGLDPEEVGPLDPDELLVVRDSDELPVAGDTVARLSAAMVGSALVGSTSHCVSVVGQAGVVPSGVYEFAFIPVGVRVSHCCWRLA